MDNIIDRREAEKLEKKSTSMIRKPDYLDLPVNRYHILDPGMISFASELIKTSKHFKENLFSIIELSKTDAEV